MPRPAWVGAQRAAPGTPEASGPRGGTWLCWGMSQRAGLTPDQAHVLARVEAIRPNYRSAAEIAPELGLAVHTAMFALQALPRRG